MLCYPRPRTEKATCHVLESCHNLLEIFAWRNAGRRTYVYCALRQVDYVKRFFHRSYESWASVLAHDFFVFQLGL